MRDAVGAGDRDQFGVRVNRDPGLDIGGELADLGGIARGEHSRDFDKTERGVCRDQSGIKMLALQVDDLCAVWIDLRSYVDDFFSVHEYVARRERLARDGMDRRPAEEKPLGMERQRTKDEQHEKQIWETR